MTAKKCTKNVTHMKVVVLLNKPTAHLEFLLSSPSLLSLLKLPNTDVCTLHGHVLHSVNSTTSIKQFFFKKKKDISVINLLRRILQCKLNWFQQCFAGEKV